MNDTKDATPLPAGERHVRNVLFVCDHNAGRSKMAQAFFERYGPDDVRAESAGSAPAHEIWPPVVEAMREIGFDLSGRKPKRLTLEMQLCADWAITLGCGDMCPYVPSAVEAWDVPDPAGLPIAEVRVIRDELQNQVRVLLAVHLESIRTDRTGHELRLAKLLPGLVAEFGETKPPEMIRGCAEAALATFDDARIRSHVLTLAHRKTRECLREETCALVPGLVA